MERAPVRAILHDVAHLEIGLRNAYDAAITSSTAVDGPHWVFAPARYFPPTPRKAKNGAIYDVNQTSRDQIARAVSGASTPRRDTTPDSAWQAPPPGKVIAELTFGFWRYLSTAAHHHSLWIPYLHKAFLPGTSRPDVDRPIARIHSLRNRVAHHEPLLNQNVAARIEDILGLAGLISGNLRDYIPTASRCGKLLASRP